MAAFKILVQSLAIVALATRGNCAPQAVEVLATNAGTYTENVTCNDAGTVCVKCFGENLFGKMYLEVLEYMPDPYRVLLTLMGGVHNVQWSFTQDEPSELFRVCHLASTRKNGTFMTAMDLELCLSNDFSGVDLPGEGCSRPIALANMITSSADSVKQTMKALYCMPR